MDLGTGNTEICKTSRQAEIRVGDD
jgi:hypothetical protein